MIYRILIWIFHKPLFTVLGTNTDTEEYVSQYLFRTVMNTEFAHLIRSEGYAKEASFGVALSGILNIVLDPLFIFTFHMNIRGTAIAAMLSNTCAVIYFLIFLTRIRTDTTITASQIRY